MTNPIEDMRNALQQGAAQMEIAAAAMEEALRLIGASPLLAEQSVEVCATICDRLVPFTVNMQARLRSLSLDLEQKMQNE